jgi:hypothetical protein|tara:strand:+ start:377 stop:481 length:105 start_codon:yes stop_codon:yes gene_type:complete
MAALLALVPVCTPMGETQIDAYVDGLRIVLARNR